MQQIMATVAVLKELFRLDFQKKLLVLLFSYFAHTDTHTPADIRSPKKLKTCACNFLS